MILRLQIAMPIVEECNESIYRIEKAYRERELERVQSGEGIEEGGESIERSWEGGKQRE